MKIAVCIKQILDPEVPPRDFRIDPVAKQPIRGQAKMVISSFDENALETAIQLKEKHGASVTAICMGPKEAEEALRRALAMTADEAVRIDAPADQDAAAAAAALAEAIRGLGGADLVLVGRQAGDWDRGQVGPMLAEGLGWACVTAAYGPELVDGGLRVRREVSGGVDVVDVKLPAVIAITNAESNVPRIPKVKDTMMAMRKPIKVVPAAGEAGAPAVTLVALEIPEADGNCEFIEGDDGPARAAALAKRLQDLKLL